jgi:hypothetical protein
VGQPALDPQEFLEHLKAEHQVLQWEPLPPDDPARVQATDQTRTRSSLEYLHRHWALPDAFDPADVGGGVRGRIVSMFGRLTYRVLGRYLREERDLLAHVVRVNEALQRRCDELSQRCQQLGDDMVRRQAAEASNQAKLALWLHLDPPTTASPPSGSHNGRSEAGESSST